LPAAAPGVQPAPAPLPDAEREAPGGAERARILVVDDNTDAADMLAESCRLMGYATAVAHDGPAALQIAVRFHPQIALLDIGLPVMDGYELARHLRALPGLSSIGLVAVTGYGQASDRKRAEQAGFEHHLVKPIQLEVLEGLLASRARANQN